MWENNGDNGQYGTTMALMLLPHWTDGCIASMEGLFFEASGTTPYHFLTAAAMSSNSSNPVRELRYDDNDAAKGVPYLQTLGVKYLMVFTESGQGAGRHQPRADQGRPVGPVEHLPGRRQRPGRAAHRAAGGRQRSRRRPARAQPRARHELVPAPRRVGGDAGRRRPGRVAADRRRRSTRRRSDGLAPGASGRKVDIVATGRADRRRRRSRRSRVSNVQLGDQDLASTSTRSACRCWSRSATSRTGRSAAPRARIASPRT